MIIFGWILWGILVFAMVCTFIQMAINNYKGEKYRISVIRLLWNIALLIFLSLYIFVR